MCNSIREVCAKKDKQFISYENTPRFKGHHTSLTEEMEVSLIILKS